MPRTRKWRRAVSAACLLLSVFIAVSGRPLQAAADDFDVNLLQNPGFEDGFSRPAGWESTGADSAIASFVVLTADQHGNPLMVVTVRARLTLADGGQSWTGAGQRSFVDAAGNALATQPAIVTGQRITAEAPDAATMTDVVATLQAG